MARIHMLKNKRLAIDDTELVRTGKRVIQKHRARTFSGKLLYLLAGAALFFLVFVMAKTAFPCIHDLIFGSDEAVEQMPFWIRWPAMLGRNSFHYLWYQPDPIFPELDISNTGFLLIIGKLIVWLVKFLFNALILILEFILHYAFALIVSLLPFLLIIAAGVFGCRMLLFAFGYNADETEPIYERRAVQSGAHEKGLEGEKAAMELLSRLPDSYHVFGNLQFEYLGREGKPRPGEADFVVVGASGLHLVEVKHWNGTISKGRNDRVVRHTKTGGIVSEEKSPFYQAKSNSGKLGHLVRQATGIPVRMSANVLFTDSRLEIAVKDPEDCSVYQMNGLGCPALLNALQKAESALSADEVKRIAAAIENKIWKPEFSADVLRYLEADD